MSPLNQEQNSVSRFGAFAVASSINKLESLAVRYKMN